jgi:hypothetical protein
MKILIFKSIPIFLLFTMFSSILLTSCGISQSQLDEVIAEKEALQNELDTIHEVYPLKEFETLSEFKAWIKNHVQPETTYIEDAFLAAYKVQQEGLSDGYLFGLDVDQDEDGYPNLVFVTTFIGNELYYWYVEAEEIYGSFDLKR